MQIAYAGLVLAPGGLAGEPADLRIGNEFLTEQAQFFRALESAWYARGNASVEFGFSVTRIFATLAEAAQFMFVDAADIDPSGEVQVTSGAATLYLPGAVLKGVQLKPIGVSVDVTYNFAGPKFGDTSS